MNFTHRRISRLARCTQFNHENIMDIIYLLSKDEKNYVTRFGTEIMVRLDKPERGQKSIETISEGWWVVEKENGQLALYSPAQFETRYEPCV